MKTALSTMPNAPSMPEHYWRISRQEAGASGRTYSIIEQVSCWHMPPPCRRHAPEAESSTVIVWQVEWGLF